MKKTVIIAVISLVLAPLSCKKEPPLHEALDRAAEGDEARLEAPIAEGADVNAVDSRGETPPMKAAGAGRDATVRLPGS